jgi:hypothetical protein
MQLSQAAPNRAKKRAPLESGALKWWQMGEGGGYAICRFGPFAEGGGTAQIRCRDTQAEGGGYSRGLSDEGYMTMADPSCNAPAHMPAMHFLHDCLTA